MISRLMKARVFKRLHKFIKKCWKVIIHGPS